MRLLSIDVEALERMRERVHRMKLGKAGIPGEIYMLIEHQKYRPASKRLPTKDWCQFSSIPQFRESETYQKFMFVKLRN